MIVGHFGVSFAIKSVRKDVPLWVLFVAVQILDFLWLTFVSTNIEQAGINRQLPSVPIEFYHMPYSHSLLGALMWSGVTFVVYKLIPLGRHTMAARMVALAVLSHWIVDIFVHRPDLALYDDAYKIGLSGWNFPLLGYLLEGACLFAGIALYLRVTTPRTIVGRYAAVAYGIALMGVQAVVVFGLINPPNMAIVLAGVFIFYVIAGALAYAVERTRT